MDHIKGFLGFILATVVVIVSLVLPIIILYYLFGFGAYTRNGFPQ